jgi:hypothetical protein
MAITFKGKTVTLSDIVTVEEAQALHELLLEKEDLRFDLRKARHVHTAVLQVLIAARPKVAHPFDDKFLCEFVLPAFS